jgi:hypothetical protein
MAFKFVSQEEYEKGYITLSEEDFNRQLKLYDIKQMKYSTPLRYIDLLESCGISVNGFLNISFYDISKVTFEENRFFYTLYVKEMSVLAKFKRTVDKFTWEKKTKIALIKKQHSANTEKLKKQRASLKNLISLMKKSTKKSTPDQQKQKEINELKATMEKNKERNDLLEREFASLLSDSIRLDEYYLILKGMENVINNRYHY